MKRFRLHMILAVFFMLTGIVVFSCERDLDLTDPSYQTTDNYYENSDELLAGTNAIYSSLHSGQLVAREWFFLHDLRSDEVAAGGGQLEVPRRQILSGSVTPDNAVMNDVWNGLYAVIHRSNVVIDNGPNVEDNTELRDRLVAEARFLRGWAYFELVSLWGPVPLYTTVVESPDQFQARAPEDSIYMQITTDLEEASNVLPASYPNEDRARATRGAANAMLGRVYMQQLDFAAAKTHLQEVIDSGQYSLADDYLDNFREETEFNEESIFEVAFIDKGDDAFNWGYTGDGANAA
ncbi:MAG TPA: RagB/SusD family nutrient uptake outer membrane protein, partial [Fodinibius sp.]|nr:RagB/SusD family nutrient uptake outer membrane protein [Fodinibius sp.]